MSPLPIDYWPSRYPAVVKEKTKLQKAIIATRLPVVVGFLHRWSEPYKGWAPHNLFYDTYWKSSSYTVYRDTMDHSAFLGCGTTTVYKAGDTKHYSYEKKNFTPLGQWFEDMPGIFQIVKVPYYLVMWPITFILVAVRMLISGLFLPKKKDSWL